MTRVAALVIGNEILTGKVQETNVARLARELFTLGAELRKVIVCRDTIGEIAADLQALREGHDWVITSGGVGPTHDDVTIKAVARAFGTEIARSPELEGRIREQVGERLTEGHLRMADIPAGAELVETADVPWPTILMGNVFVMPGLPEIFRMKLPVLRQIIPAAEPFLSEAVYTSLRESELAELLDRLDADHGPEVMIGSYPVFGQSYRVRITFDSKSAAALERARAELLASLAPEVIVAAPS